jgi:hypothetical protein
MEGNNSRTPILEGGLWAPGTLPPLKDRASLSCKETAQTYLHHGDRMRRLLEGDGLLRRLVLEYGMPLNLRPPGLLPTLPFLPLLRVAGERVQALLSGGGWLLERGVGELSAAVQDALGQMACMGEESQLRWQADTGLSEDDPEAEALAVLLVQCGWLPLPGRHHLLTLDPQRGILLLTGPGVGVRMITTFWETEALRLARAALLDHWIPLSDERIKAIYRTIPLDDMRAEETKPGRFLLNVDGNGVTLVDCGVSWRVGQRRTPKRRSQPDHLTLLWAARAGTAQRRSRRFWRMSSALAPLALARSGGAGLLESVAAHSLIRRRMVCPDCRASFVVGDACLNTACSSHGSADIHALASGSGERGAPLVYIRDGAFLYAPGEPGWVEERDGGVRGVIGSTVAQLAPLGRVVVRRANERTALSIAHLLSFTEREPPIEARLPLPAPPRELETAARSALEREAPFPDRFSEALRKLCGDAVKVV